MEIKSERLLLRPISIKDLVTTHAYASDCEANIYMLNLPNDTLQQTENFLKGCEDNWKTFNQEVFQLDFAIIFDGKHVGGISLSKEVGPETEIGWILNCHYWQKGIAFEAAKTLVDYFTKNYQINHYIAHCDSENKASYALMEKLGMTRVSVTGGRFNKGSQSESQEYLYELKIGEEND